MRDLCLACVGILLLSMVFFCTGSLFMHKLHIKADAALAFVLGYLVYFAVFEILFVPMILKWVSLTKASYVWLAVMTAVVLCAVICCRKMWMEQLRGTGKEIRKHSCMLMIALAVIVIQCLIVCLYQDSTVDATYYVGNVTTSVYTDTMGRYSPYTGEPLNYFHARYVFSAYPMNNAVWCRLTGIHPIVQSKIVMSCLNIVTANLLIYQIGRRLFHDNRKKADLMLVFVCLLQLFCGTIYSTGTFFFTRIYEGKALIGNIAIPMALFCALWYLDEKENRKIWVVLFVASVAALAFSASAIIFPVAVLGGMGSAAIINRKPSGFLYSLICMLPIVFYLAIFFVNKVGLLMFPAF